MRSTFMLWIKEMSGYKLNFLNSNIKYFYCEHLQETILTERDGFKSNEISSYKNFIIKVSVLQDVFVKKKVNGNPVTISKSSHKKTQPCFFKTWQLSSRLNCRSTTSVSKNFYYLTGILKHREQHIQGVQQKSYF